MESESEMISDEEIIGWYCGIAYTLHDLRENPELIHSLIRMDAWLPAVKSSGPESDWKCSYCGHTHPEKEYVCSHCGASKQ